MSPLLQQFIHESRDFIQDIGNKLMALEERPDDPELMTELFRLVHTLKGNSGLFDFPGMTRVLHAGEDLMDAVRDGRVVYSRELADSLLDAMDFVSALIDQIENSGEPDAGYEESSLVHVAALKTLMPVLTETEDEESPEPHTDTLDYPPAPPMESFPESARMAAWCAAEPEVPLYRVRYYPDAECFFNGEDPFHQARQTPGIVAGRMQATSPWPALAELDCYHCVMAFDMLIRGDRDQIMQHYRYVPEQIVVEQLPLIALVIPQGHPNGGPVYEDFVAEALASLDANDLAGLKDSIEVMLDISAPDLWLSSALRWLKMLLTDTPEEQKAIRLLILSLQTLTGPVWTAEDWGEPTDNQKTEETTTQPQTEADTEVNSVSGSSSVVPLGEKDQTLVDAVLDVQRQVLALNDNVPWIQGRLKGCAATLHAMLTELGEADDELNQALASALALGSSKPLADWLDSRDSRCAKLTDPENNETQQPSPEVSAPKPIEDEDQERIHAILSIQADILALPDNIAWLQGRLQSCATTLRAVLSYYGESPDELDEAVNNALSAQSGRPLEQWLRCFLEGLEPLPGTDSEQNRNPAPPPMSDAGTQVGGKVERITKTPAVAEKDNAPRFGRRAEDAQAGKILKVDQQKVDRLMNLIGEMVVAKNGLPYLARRAEDDYGVRELSRDIKAQYAVINRISDEMQDAIMQVRMMPVSFVFQRFPRLVRDLSKKLNKDIKLVLEGEDTEADKNIVEALADPLVHIVRNSLDHGLEPADQRIAAGKPATGKLLIRAISESDRVLIEIIDDGKGIDPAIIKKKAYEKSIIDESQLERMSDQEAINLIFAAGFSTAEQVSDLSGRGVGMDVVKNALNKIGGTVNLSSVLGQGTTLRLNLPLSMAVTNVMVIESNNQIFGLPMDQVIETVRLPQQAVNVIKYKKTALLRDRIVPLIALNDLLAIDAVPRTNADDELAVVIVRVDGEPAGLLVDEFREVIDVILKPLPGALATLNCYAGSALLGDGSVLMVINPKELF